MDNRFQFFVVVLLAMATTFVHPSAAPPPSSSASSVGDSEVAEGGGLYFSVEPRSQSVTSGHPVLLECDVATSDEGQASRVRRLIFSWTLDGRPVANDTRRHQVGSNLRVRRADRTDAGEYRCVVVDQLTGLSMISSPAVVDVLWLDESVSVVLQSTATDQSSDAVRDGSELVLRCRSDGYPEVRYEWYRNGIRLFRSDRITLKGKRLEVTNVSAHDNGIYSCRAINDAGAVDSGHNFALALRHEHAAYIRQLPRDVIVRRSDPAYFDCVYDDATITEWYSRNEGPLTNNSRMTVYPNGSLHINRVKNSDEGLYRCVGIRGVIKDEPVQTYVVELKIATMDQSQREEEVFEPSSAGESLNVVAEGTVFEVTCLRPRGQPTPTLWWEDPLGKVIADTGHIRVDDSRLVVDGAQQSDAGNYSCVAENLAGTRRNAIHVYVTVRPKIVSRPQDQSVEEGRPARFDCSYSGSPPPHTSFGWTRDDRFAVDSDQYRSFVDPLNGTLVISAVLTTDAGQYTCHVHTVGFEPIRSEPSVLHVRENLKFVPVPVNTRLELGSRTKIHCKARGSVRPDVRWAKDGVIVSSGGWTSPHVRDENGTLHFDAVTTEDEGRYTCVASSLQGLINATIQVEVIVKPKFTVRPENTEAYEGYPTVLHCQAHGDPLPHIQWDKNTVPNGFDRSRFRVMENGSLFVEEVHMEDQGKYGCTIGNSGGLKREEVSLLVRSSEDFELSRSMLDGGGGDGGMGAAGAGGGGGGNGPGGERRADNVMTKTVVITLGAATAYMGLVIGLMVWCRCRRARRKAQYLQEAIAEGTQLNKTENGDAMHDQGAAAAAEAEALGGPSNVSGGGGGSGGSRAATDGTRKAMEYRDNVKSDGEVRPRSQPNGSNKNRASGCDRLQFPRHELQSVMVILGKGEFGEVFLAKARGIEMSSDGQQAAASHDVESVVMVKKLQSRAESAHLDFRREIDMYQKLSHVNVARLQGVCREAEPFLMIMEYSDFGDLKQYLLATRDDNPRKSPRPSPLTVSQMLQMCHQVALAMEYVAERRFVHGDLAARNCLVTSGLDVKVSNPSLSRDTYSREYYRGGLTATATAAAAAGAGSGGANGVSGSSVEVPSKPIRWMPREAVFEDEVSTKSDVYAFAVLVWEMFSQAELPFVDLTDDAFLKALKSSGGLKWSMPTAVNDVDTATAVVCPEGLNDLLVRCWSDSPRVRPSFADVVLQLAEIHVDSVV